MGTTGPRCGNAELWFLVGLEGNLPAFIIFGSGEVRQGHVWKKFGTDLGQ